MSKFVQFLVAHRYITPGETMFKSHPHKDTPWWICIWILTTCDIIDVNGDPIPKSRVVPTYAHAQKMRAAMTYAFGRLHQLGSVPWQDFPHPAGNPSVSEIVSSYMVSLRRRKVQAGETQVSSHAITADILLKLYNYNTGDGRSNQPVPGSWCGPRTRLMIQAACTVAFACLLRFDEVLRILMSDLEFLCDNGGPLFIKLTLRSRKTAQFGGIQPFYLHMLPVHEAHLCPVRALCFWIASSQYTTRYLFRTITKNGHVSMVNRTISSTAFLLLFRNNLLDVKIDPAPYGTHSIRRGEVQYLLIFKWKGIHQICEWGGWSTDFTSTSVLRYIISLSDDVQLIREDFLDPNRPPQLKCYVCGRGCHCS
ncbi:DNA breaking-rejoining enzyme [Mycena maculata]|uniref:DNA breaking-rejoining enzyme n=1 Tax=Mycena maculata TaxID=230809 RepID=A0AAD7HB03_9AGAR|nr:DNA breaking-rejoining enzyme [Mycena maculata]